LKRTLFSESLDVDPGFQDEIICDPHTFNEAC